MVDIIFVSKQKKQQESFFFLLNPMALCTFLSFLKQIVGFSTIVVVGNLFFFHGSFLIEGVCGCVYLI